MAIFLSEMARVWWGGGSDHVLFIWTYASKMHISFISFFFVCVGKLKECSVLQFRLNLQTHQAVWFSGSAKASQHTNFSTSEKLYSMKEKCICWEGTRMLKTHCYCKSWIWDTVHNAVCTNSAILNLFKPGNLLSGDSYLWGNPVHLCQRWNKAIRYLNAEILFSLVNELQ